MDTLAKLNTGFIITAIGMGVVFIVLVFLSYTFNLMELVFNYRKRTKSGIETAGGSGSDVISDIGDFSGIVAVISAAVSSCMGSKARFVVRSITRAGDAVPVWGKTGRHDQMKSRMIE